MKKTNYMVKGREAFEESDCIKGLERIGEAIGLESTSVGSNAVKYEGIYTFRTEYGHWRLPFENVEPMKAAMAADRGPAQVAGGNKAFAKVERGVGGRFTAR